MTSAVAPHSPGRAARWRGRRGLLALTALAALTALILVGLTGAASARPAKGGGSVTRAQAIDQINIVRDRVNDTLRLLDEGHRDQALAVAKAAYLDHFESVEIPLVLVNQNLKLDTEATFAELRGLISANAPTPEIRKRVIKLRDQLNQAERDLSSTGFGAPAIVFGQSFVILFREGLEAVLLLSVLLGYLESTKNGQYKKPILIGVGAAVVLAVATFFAVNAVFSVLPFGREVLEALVAFLAVAVLFYVSFWLVARLEQRRWLEFLKARVWTAVSAGSALSLGLIGFTSVYREGFETALFYQAISSFSTGMGEWVLAGVLAAVVALVVVSLAIFRLGRRLPIKAFLTGAVMVVMATSVAILGNAMYALQEAAVLDLDLLRGWPRLPIFFAEGLGYYPTLPSVLAQAGLVAIYVAGGLYTFVLRPRRQRRIEARVAAATVPAQAVAIAEPADAPTVHTVAQPQHAAGSGGVRVGVDVGGTFTKAVAFDLARAQVVARAAVPTTHEAAEGPATGVVEVVRQVGELVGPDRVELVAHSTTQAVNALLEGDVGTVGVIGMGRQPDLSKARRRTRLADVELSPGRKLPVLDEFVDVTAGLDDDRLSAVLDRLQAGGATSVCVSEAFAPEGGDNERRAAAEAAARGLPACSSSEMTGLYGLELRTVTAALNASILPIALATEEFVARGVEAVGIRCPVMVMRGDGGATDPEGFRREPARTLYSGPAASVAGVLRFTRIADGVVVEVGGTSTNVAAIKDGKPLLSYVQVASHATALRAIDVRVVGVAGGSMLRARRNRLYGVGPRSAHIAGLPYSCYLDPADLEGAEVEVISPRAGDPAEYVVVRLRDGRRAAVTNTCAAVALGIVQEGDYATGSRAAALAALGAAGRLLRLAPEEVARRMLDASGHAVADLIDAVVRDGKLSAPTIVAVGGGAGGLGRHVAAMLGLRCYVPDGAEVISSIGDALSLVRAERERSVVAPTAADSAALAAEAEAECVAAGASAASIDVRVDYEADRSTLRAVATGAVGLEAGALPGRPPIDEGEAIAVAAERQLPAPLAVGSFWLAGAGVDREALLVPAAASRASAGAAAVVGAPEPGPVAVFDRFGDVVASGTGGAVLLGTPGAGDVARQLAGRLTRRMGPMTVRPAVWLVHGSRLVAGGGDEPVDAALALAEGDEPAAIVVLRD